MPQPVRRSGGPTAFALLAATVAVVAPAASAWGQLSLLGRYNTGIFEGSAAEIAGYDSASRRLFVVNAAQRQLDILSIANPATPTKVGQIPFTTLPNSVAVRNGVVAAALDVVNADGVHLPGTVAFFDTNGAFASSVKVGALPDMLTFSPDGTKVLVANEGEPNSYGQASSVDPEGSVSIINLAGPGGVNALTDANVSTAGFGSFNGQAAALRAAGVRIFGPGASVAQDLEPEYIALDAAGTTAYVTLQENNAIATVDVATSTVTSIRPLGLKDHNLVGNGIDPSDRDGLGGTGAIGIRQVRVRGMYQPDAVATYTLGGQTYLVTANEGDARDYQGFAEEVRVGSSGYVLDPTAFPDAASLKNNANLGRLTVSRATGDSDGDGDFDQIHLFGGRSFSIFDTAGNLVFDSGDALERITAEQIPAFFNSTNSANEFDTRSDNKGPEPEGVVLGEVAGRMLAFIGLERIGGVMVYDITVPASPSFLQYLNTRDFTQPANTAAAGDLGPEGLLFIPAADSPTGVALLVVTNEVSGTTAVFSVVPEPTSLSLLVLGGAALLRRRRA
jgi:DNA-binding beta-propeller fold protein YncE